jgi:hypothetical protein
VNADDDVSRRLRVDLTAVATRDCAEVRLEMTVATVPMPEPGVEVEVRTHFAARWSPVFDVDHERVYAISEVA